MPSYREIYSEKKMLGFGTREKTNRAVYLYVMSQNGIFHRQHRQVKPLQNTLWKTFNKGNWYDYKNDICLLGTLRGTQRLLWDCKNKGINYHYIDHSYFFKGSEHKPHKTIGHKFYRVTLNGEQINYITEPDRGDLNRIERYIKICPVEYEPRKEFIGDEILICPPTEYVCRYYNIESPKVWTESKIQEIQKYTDKKINVREKNNENNRDMEDDLDHASAIVTFQSTVAIDAVLKGIPSFCDDVSMAKPVSQQSFETIDNPTLPDKDLIEQWKTSLLCNQFTIGEIQVGQAYRTIMRLQAEKNLRNHKLNDNNS